MNSALRYDLPVLMPKGHFYAEFQTKFEERSWRISIIYKADTVGRNAKSNSRIHRNQLQEDIAIGQRSLREFTDPFT
jgi:hypothetical protein